MRKGRTIRNDQTGESLTMLVSEDENDGALQLYRVHLPAYRPGPPLHCHLVFSETFTVLEGTLDMYLDRERRHVRLRAGESVTAEVRQLHTFANNADGPCIMTVETRPAGGVVKAFQIAYGVANSGGAAEDGLPKNRLIRLRFIGISQGFLPGAPLMLQRAVFAIAKFSARVTGMERRLQAYLTD